MPFQVNFVLALEPQSLGPALEAGAPIVTFSWGQPERHVWLVRSYGAKLAPYAWAPQVQCSERALWRHPNH